MMPRNGATVNGADEALVVEELLRRGGTHHKEHEENGERRGDKGGIVEEKKGSNGSATNKKGSVDRSEGRSLARSVAQMLRSRERECEEMGVLQLFEGSKTAIQFLASTSKKKQRRR